jgi:hypothetical protein
LDSAKIRSQTKLSQRRHRLPSGPPSKIWILVLHLRRKRNRQTHQGKDLLLVSKRCKGRQRQSRKARSICSSRRPGHQGLRIPFSLARVLKLSNLCHCKKIGNERFLAPEILFNPELIGLEISGVHQNIADSIQKTDVDLRRALYSNIVLSGGSTLFKGTLWNTLRLL